MSAAADQAPPGRDLQIGESVAKALFLGEILEEQLFPYPRLPDKDRESLGMMLEAIDRFLADRREEFRRWDREAHQPEEFIEALRQLGLFSLIIPEAHDGLGLSNAAYARVLEQTSRYDSSTSLTIGAHSSIGMKGLLLFGDEQQRRRYLPRLATGEMIAAFCLTESLAGSDAASIRTRAVRDGDGWRLNGEKIWITNGGIADLYTVFARTDSEAGKLSAFIVERAWPGVSVGAHEDKHGIRASSTTTVSFADVQVPPENLLGEEGKGFKIAMAILNNGRTGLGGGAVGAMKTCIELAVRQAQERRQFERPIAEFGLVREKIARMAVDCFAAESAVWMVASYIDGGATDYSVEAAISKVYASEAAQRTADAALQIAAGNGYMKEFPYEQILRDSRILTIFEGTSEILRLYIALSGLKQAGAVLSELKNAVDDIFNDFIKGFGILSSYAGRRLSQVTPLGRDRILAKLPGELLDEALVFEKYAAELARSSDALLRRYGKVVVDRQHDLRRLADTAIDLFVGLCVLSRASSIEGDEAARRNALLIARLFSQQAKRRMNQNLRRIGRNEDALREELVDYVLGQQGFSWDVF